MFCSTHFRMGFHLVCVLISNVRCTHCRDRCNYGNWNRYINFATVFPSLAFPLNSPNTKQSSVLFWMWTNNTTKREPNARVHLWLRICFQLLSTSIVSFLNCLPTLLFTPICLSKYFKTHLFRACHSMKFSRKYEKLHFELFNHIDLLEFPLMHFACTLQLMCQFPIMFALSFVSTVHFCDINCSVIHNLFNVFIQLYHFQWEMRIQFIQLFWKVELTLKLAQDLCWHSTKRTNANEKYAKKNPIQSEHLIRRF